MVGKLEHLLGEPLMKRGIIAELLEELGVVGEQLSDSPLQRLIVFKVRVLFTRVLYGVLVRFVGRYLSRDLLGYDLLNLVLVFSIPPKRSLKSLTMLLSRSNSGSDV